MPRTVQHLIDSARLRHWSFANIALGDGAALLYLQSRQLAHLAEHGAAIEGLVGTTVQYDTALQTTGTFVALDANGVPFYSTTLEDGYAVHLDGNGVPYIDTSEAPLAVDPFGASGGTPGFPLPSDMLRLISVACIYTNNRIIPCDVIPERMRFTTLPGRNPNAFVSGNRLVPLLPLSEGNSGDRWFSVRAVQISYVPIQTLTALDDEVLIPAVLCDALVADLALMFANQSEKCPAKDCAAIEREAERCAARIAVAADDMLDSVQHNSIVYRR